MSSLLVIGNGFDLCAGAETSYSEFFESVFYCSRKTKLIDWYNNVTTNGIYIIQFNPCDEFNCWELLFYLQSKDNLGKKNEIKWCDIEQVMHDSLIAQKKYHNRVFWIEVQRLLNNYLSNSNLISQMNKGDAEIIALYLLSCDWKTEATELETFYDRLMQELNEFEKIFGHYISEVTDQNDYYNKAQTLARNLIGKKTSYTVDSFNYSDYDGTVDIRHINGDTLNPIFGIDLTDEERKAYPESIRFTKTSRRLLQDSYNLNRTSTEGVTSIERAVVFGHSLNPMDYDYFFYLFTLLHFHTFDIKKMGSIVFFYDVYDSSTSDKIRTDLTDAIYKLLNYYEDHMSQSRRNILINFLRFSGKLKIKELI